MAKIKIYGLNASLSKYAGQFSIAIDDAVAETLSYSPEKSFTDSSHLSSLNLFILMIVIKITLLSTLRCLNAAL